MTVAARPEVKNDSFECKLKKHCPSLFLSLSALESDKLDPSFALYPETTSDDLSREYL